MAAHDHHSDGLATVLDLDAEVLRPFHADLAERIAELAGTPPQRALDLGSGTGAGTFALLEHFPGLAVTALDSSADMLAHLRGKAAERGLAGRVETARADLDEPLPELGGVDLAWASASLHHLADPDRTLREIARALRPGGLLVAVEMDAFPRFLPHDAEIGRPGLEDRIHAIVDERRGEHLPHFGAAWGERIAAAGFAVELERIVPVELTSPLPAAAVQYAEVALRHLRESCRDRLDEDDRAALDELVDGDSPAAVRRRADLTVRTSRQVTIARRR